MFQTAKLSINSFYWDISADNTDNRESDLQALDLKIKKGIGPCVIFYSDLPQVTKPALTTENRGRDLSETYCNYDALLLIKAAIKRHPDINCEQQPATMLLGNENS